MKIILILTMLCGLGLTAQADAQSPPSNEFIPMVSSDLQPQLASDWQVEAVAERDSCGYQVFADNPKYRRFWVCQKVYQWDKAHPGQHHKDPEGHLPLMEDYGAFQRHEIAERNMHNAPVTTLNQSGNTTLGPLQYIEGTIGFVFIAIGLLLVIALYFLPTIIAVLRGIPQVMTVVIINTIFGWTLIGWVVAMCFACWSYSRSATATKNYNPS